MAPTPTCNYLKCQQAAVKAETEHAQVVLSVVKVACSPSADVILPPVQIAKELLANIDTIGELFKEGKISSAQIKKVRIPSYAGCT